MADEPHFFSPDTALGLTLNSGRIAVETGRGSRVLRIDASQSGISVSTPDPAVAQVWLARDDQSWIIATDEAAMLAELSSWGGSVEDCLDISSVLLRWELGHALLAPSVTESAVALPAATTIQLRGRSADEAMKSAKLQLSPVPGSPNELLEMIVERYRQTVGDAPEVGVLVSAGWDSRIEVAALHAALSRNQKMHLIHVYSGEADKQVAEAIARTTGATLTILGPGPLLSAGLASGRLRQTLAREATWRPTVPLFATALANMRLSIEGPVVGLVMTELKGRAYDQEISPNVPTEGKLRARIPGHTTTSLGSGSADVALERQQSVWRSVLDLSEGWPLSARRDHLWWQVNYGFTHSHRIRAVRPFVNVAPWHSSEVLARFMGLPPEAKAGNQFILSSLAKLGSGLDRVPVIGSSGDGTHLTDSVSGDFAPPQVDFGVLFSDGHRPPDMHLRHFDESPPVTLYAHALSRTSDLALVSTRSTIGRELLLNSRSAQDHRLVNAIQLTEFIDTTIQEAELLKGLSGDRRPTRDLNT